MNTAVTANTICSYSGTEKNYTLPLKIALVDIKAVGDGAFLGNDFLHSLDIPKGISTIGEYSFGECTDLRKVTFYGVPDSVGQRAFVSCHNLNEVEFKDLYVSKARYEELRSESAYLSDGTTVTSKVPEDLLPKGFILSLGTKFAAANVPTHITELFMRLKPKDTVAFEMLYNNETDADDEAVAEHRAFMNCIKNPDSYDLSDTAEKTNDEAVKADRNISSEIVSVFTFDDSKTVPAGDGYLIDATVKIGSFFWQSAKKVIFGGKEYYIYRRHHLTHKADMEYIRQDVAVYTDEGLVKNREETKKVYAKYRLLSLI